MKFLCNVSRSRLTLVTRCAFLFVALHIFVSAQVVRPEQDTVRITLSQAEVKFLQNNVQLLASKFSIDAAKAAIMQENLWENPNIAIEQNIYDPMTGRYFDFTRSGNTEVQVQQLFLLAGKRGKHVRLAEINAQIAENTFFDLLRALKLELRKDLFGLFFLQQSLRFYDESVAAVKRTVEAMENIFQQRSILLSELLRLKSLLFSLQNERLDVLTQIAEKEGSLRVLVRDTSAVSSYFVPLLDKGALDSVTIDTLSLRTAIASALEHRPDIKTAEQNVRFEEANLSLQKAMAIPDVTIGGRWSRAGSYIPDYFAVSVAVDLPLFRRNQGNIIVSERTLETNRLLYENSRQVVEQDVVKAYTRAIEADNLYHSFDPRFADEYRTLVNGMIANYRQRNISIIQFTDFYESYRTSVVQMNQLQNNRLDAFEELNYAAGTTLVNP